MGFFERNGPVCAAAALLLAGCEAPVMPAAQVPPPSGYAPPGQYAPGVPPGQYVPAQPPPWSVPVPNDPINTVDVVWLRGMAGSVLGALVEALPPDAKAKVQGVPLANDPTVGEINAYASCDEQHMPRMAVTDGLLQIESYIAQFRATDEIFGTQKLDGYLQMVVTYQKPHQPIVAPPMGFVDPVQNADGRKVMRQHQLFEEQLAFVLGHELAHHHLGHTGCANGQSGERGVTLGDVLRLPTRVVPITNQPFESAADWAGTNNVLEAGKRRGQPWNEEGAVLTLGFFGRMEPLNLEAWLTSPLLGHANPALREPIVRQAAAAWRAKGGAWVPPPWPAIP